LFVMHKLVNDEVEEEKERVGPAAPPEKDKIDPDAVRKKVRSLGMMLKMYTVLRCASIAHAACGPAAHCRLAGKSARSSSCFAD
jgi:hypothetical protein